jgi:septal ring factor EnvC (AmiA/AmiB activator)
MAQLKTMDVKVLVDMDVSRARHKVKQIRNLTEELNKDLAQLEERLGTFGAKLREFGIGLEVGND